MSKVAIIFYSQTGNTEELAKEIAAGVRAAGGEADLMRPQEVKHIRNYDSVALGCPAMGFEEIDADEDTTMSLAFMGGVQALRRLPLGDMAYIVPRL